MKSSVSRVVKKALRRLPAQDELAQWVRPRVIMVGLGKQGQVHWAALHRLHQLGELELVATVDPVAAGWPEVCPHFSELSAALALHSAELVVICAPNQFHLQLAEIALRHGAAVVKEKPLAYVSGDAQRLESLSHQLGLPVMTLQQRRFLPLFQLAQQRLPEIGELSSCAYTLSVNDWQPSWYWTAAAAGGGSWWNLGWHVLSTLQWLVGPVELVEMVPHHHQARTWQYQGDDLVTAKVSFANGAVGMVAVSNILPKTECLEFRGSHGKLQLTRDQLHLTTPVDDQVITYRWSEPEVYLAQWLSVLCQLKSDQHTMREDVQLVDVMSQAYQAAIPSTFQEVPCLKS